jgi:hypothetical protein
MSSKISGVPTAAKRAPSKTRSVKGKAAAPKPKVNRSSGGWFLRCSQGDRSLPGVEDLMTEAELRMGARLRIRKKPVPTPKSRRAAEEATKIIKRVTPWAGSADQASAWYRSQPIPAFGNRTAEAIVRAGKAKIVHAYLDSIALGGFA